jgi:hypothetical protein
VGARGLHLRQLGAAGLQVMRLGRCRPGPPARPRLVVRMRRLGAAGLQGVRQARCRPGPLTRPRLMVVRMRRLGAAGLQVMRLGRCRPGPLTRPRLVVVQMRRLGAAGLQRYGCLPRHSCREDLVARGKEKFANGNTSRCTGIELIFVLNRPSQLAFSIRKGAP